MSYSSVRGIAQSKLPRDPGSSHTKSLANLETSVAGAVEMSKSQTPRSVRSIAVQFLEGVGVRSRRRP